MFVVFPLRGTYSQPCRTAFWDDGCHTYSLVLLVCESLMQVARMVLMYSPTHALPGRELIHSFDQRLSSIDQVGDCRWPLTNMESTHPFLIDLIFPCHSFVLSQVLVP